MIDKYGTLTKDVNINLPIETNRLILKPFDKETSKIYDEYFFKHKSEYTKYYYDNYGNEFRYNFMENKSLGFVVFLKDGNTQIGSVGLTYCGNTKYNVEYFIMKDYRQKGYAYEALNCLLNEVKNNNLFILGDTLRMYVYDFIHPDIRCLKITANKENVASQRIAEKSGFKKYGTLLFTTSYDGKYYDDFVYYLVLNEDRTDKSNR